MTPCADLAGDARVLFVAAAGPRRGYGHLVRCISFARALGVRPLVAVRGGRRVLETGLGLGADVLSNATPRILAALAPDVVIVDDPVETTAKRWIDAARRSGALVVTVHDLGIGCHDSDLAIDGSVTSTARPKGRALPGPGRSGGQRSLNGSRYAVLDPSISRAIAERRRAPDAHRVLIALGGGPRLKLAGAIAEAIVAAEPHAEVRIASGFVVAPRPASSNVVWIGAAHGLARELADATVAVVGGGVSLYESCALGVPTVAVPVVRAQEPTVRAFARRGVVVGTRFGESPRQVAGNVVSLLNDRARRRALARRARHTVDGLGSARAAAVVVSMVGPRRRADKAVLAGRVAQRRADAPREATW